MADISMCLHKACPRRLLCERHVDSGVHERDPRRQSFGGFAPDAQGDCFKFVERLHDNSPAMLAGFIPAEVWAESDAARRSEGLVGSALVLASSLRWHVRRARAVAALREVVSGLDGEELRTEDAEAAFRSEEL